MFLETIHAEGLGCLSYIFGDGGKAAVIDPRRDCKIYKEIADKHSAQITHIFETHRNEDFVIGSLELARRTGAKIYHGTAMAFNYGEPACEDDIFELGSIKLKILETPGHTPESISIALYDTGFGDNPIAVFTGDALFIGDVGRTDFYTDQKKEMAEVLYDSIHNKLLPLGDHVILHPAHAEGSVCGRSLASREFSTLGYERQFNPMLQLDKETFIEHKMSEEHYYAPYFKQMEKLNQEGIPLKAKLPEPKPISVDEFAIKMKQGAMVLVDTRSPEAFAGAHIPGSLSIPLDMLPAFAGWFLPYDKDIGLIIEQEEDAKKAQRFLMRIGFDNASYYLADGMHGWNASGRDFSTIPTVHVNELKRRIKAQENFIILDVRSHEEFKENPSEYSEHFYVGELPQHLSAIPRDRKIITFCASGRRAIIAASILKQTDWFKDIEVCLGSMAAMESVKEAKHPLISAA